MITTFQYSENLERRRRALTRACMVGNAMANAARRLKKPEEVRLQNDNRMKRQRNSS
jgi:hypothetical protein